MLHELFLLLSGNPSPLLTANGLLKSFPLVSPSERALLDNFSNLGHLHISLRRACSSITTSHPSTIARAVASGIETHHLQRFRTRILAVEESILKRQTGIVDGYDIVSLAKVMSGFDGWDRILRYLSDLVEAIAPSKEKDGVHMSGAEIINRLRKDIYTGYPSLEEASLHLLEIAETAWLREISTWVLYGRLPSSSTYGSSSPSTDFFITEVEGDVVQNPGGEEEMGVLKEYTINKRLLPGFVTAQTASSIVFIGRALSMIRLRGGLAATNESTAAVASPEMTLLPMHLTFLQSLKSPLTPQKLTNAIAAIRLSLSRHTLQTLLPAEKVLDAIHVLREFFLLGRGEFALNLIEQSSERVRNRWRRPGALKAPTGGVLIKEGEVSAILTRTWGVLSSLQGEEVIDERLDTARDLLFLSLYQPPASTPGKKSGDSFKDILVGVPISLNFHLSWPLELFLQPTDLEDYDSIFAYLIAVRKAQMRLQSLWQGRRQPVQTHVTKEERISRKAVFREREAKERKIWATASVTIFFLETLVSYWQGEVIESAFKSLVDIVSPPQATADDDDEDEGDIWRHTSTMLSSSSRPSIDEATLQDIDHDQKQQDPESLMRAHYAYLVSIRRNLFMEDIVFAPLIKNLLQQCDVMAGGIERLRHRYTIQDLDVQNLMMGDEESARQAVLERCRGVTALLKQLMGRLHRIDEEREEWDDGRGEGAKVDRLLMRMDLGNLDA
ncbi:gamma-tubulin complex component protein [Tricharina praecox]|uniref:gamma-tubulin complex component protein n=1 Tax=Tricharina praecox TaxID=43433 RepID=UPI0022203BC5|nr:gamma-tubulin complex component protein [Tricharina praecox]KAI5849180.1 gamma-tubulin complex component protein [Tricharina praecox]